MQELHSLICNGELEPGQRLILREIAQEFGCSEIPVREALNSLASLGLVTITPHEGARVSDFDLNELIELTEIRLVLETAATLKALERVDAETMARLAAIVEQMEQAVEARDRHRYADLNRLFHEALYERCGNAKMIATIQGLRQQSERGRAVHSMIPTHNIQSLKIHKHLVKVLEGRDPARLEAALREHNANALHAMREMAGEHGAPRKARRSTAG